MRRERKSYDRREENGGGKEAVRKRGRESITTVTEGRERRMKGAGGE